MKYKLGLDMGATSIGWAITDFENGNAVDFGVRIFPDGRDDKSKASLCVKRRDARGARRLQKRHLLRKNEIVKTLVEMELFPKDIQERKKLESLNPYELRSKAVTEKIGLFDLGRALFHLSQRRGFLSNRKDNKEEGGKLKKGFEELKEVMKAENCITYGQYLYKQSLKTPKPALRLKDSFDENGAFKGNLFPFRETYQDEFNKIWNKQAKEYPDILTEENKKKLFDVFFFQRPLKEQEEGFCIFEEGERRIPKASPLFQEFRFLQIINNLKYSEKNSVEYTSLTEEKYKKQRETLIETFLNPEEIKTDTNGRATYSTIKKLLNLSGSFNYEKSSDSDYSKGIYVDTTQFYINAKPHLKNEWNNLSFNQREQLIEVVSRPENYIDFPKTKLSIEEYENIIKQHIMTTFSFSDQSACDFLTLGIEDGFGSLSRKAIKKIIDFMRLGYEYSEACEKAGYHHSVKEYESLDALPYYGKILKQHCLGQKQFPRNDEEQYGKINNATVHVALNQLRYVVNEIIALYGKPFDICIEYARDLKASQKERVKMTDTRDKNEAENKKIIKEVKAKVNITISSRLDIQKYKIWKTLGNIKGGNALDKECPFSGDKISLHELFNGNKFQIEHLLPFSRTLDDSLNNKVIATISANKYKGNRSPYEAFGESKDGFNWKEIQSRAKKLPLEKQWRFQKNAMDKFSKNEGPIARALNDTRYMTTLIQEYLRPICDENGLKTILSVPGQLTSMVRRSWGLNFYKNKEDAEAYRGFHNHHAIDAIVISSISRGQIVNISREHIKIREEILIKFSSDFYKLRDPLTPIETKRIIKKRIRDFQMDKEEAITREYIPVPDGLNIPKIKKDIEKIYISYKPKLKNITDKNSTIGQLHEDTAYGFIKYTDDFGLTAEFKTRKNKKEEISKKDITDLIPIFRNTADKTAYFDAYKNWFIQSEKAKTMDAKTKDEKALKKEQTQIELDTIKTLRQASLKAFKWFVGGRNFCAEVYEINPSNKIKGIPTKDRGDWKTEIISNYNATIRERRNENIFYWKNKYPNAKRIMTLQINDMVMATFTREEVFEDKFIKGLQSYARGKFNALEGLENLTLLFRVKKINSAGMVFLRPHDIAKEEADQKSWPASAVSLKKYQAKKVQVTPTGRIKYAPKSS
ncbi:MAG: type II CRISPR RNA-guided endonuclease Cas9 [Alphaproteobacteria bacterium]|nr:type II CRISPR RNA-guided endonuclease Cas9 [Alphaproteobacteria bacterium]